MLMTNFTNRFILPLLRLFCQAFHFIDLSLCYHSQFLDRIIVNNILYFEWLLLITTSKTIKSKNGKEGNTPRKNCLIVILILNNVYADEFIYDTS